MGAGRSSSQKKEALFKQLLLFSALVLLAIFLARIFPRMEKGTDFPHFYAAGKIVLQGRGHALYDWRVQDEFLERYSGRIGTMYIHPPFEALIYLPFAAFSLAHAYFLWCLFNLILLTAVSKILARSAGLRWQILLPLLFLYVPLLLSFLQGQDSVLLLFFLSSAFAAFEETKKFKAGCLLGCGLLKFHLVLPIVLVLGASGKRFWAGFLMVASCLLLISAGVSGWGSLIAYPQFLRDLSRYPLIGISNQQMPNLRGLFGLLLPHSSSASLWLTVATSLVVLGFAANSWLTTPQKSRARMTLALANSVLAATLVSYLLNPHDLTLLLLPMALTYGVLTAGPASGNGLRVSILIVLAVLFLPLIHLWSLKIRVYTFVCLPILLLFVLIYGLCRKVPAATPDLPGGSPNAL